MNMFKRNKLVIFFVLPGCWYTAWRWTYGQMAYSHLADVPVSQCGLLCPSWLMRNKVVALGTRKVKEKLFHLGWDLKIKSVETGWRKASKNVSVKAKGSSSNESRFIRSSASAGGIAPGISASCFSKLLEGVVFVLSGFVNPERSVLHSQALEMGAEYRPDWNSGCTLLVCAFTNTPKFRQVADDCGTIVSKEWILDCYTQKKVVEIDNYLMHAGKPWRKTDLENSTSHTSRKMEQRVPTTKEVDSAFSKDKASTKNYHSSKVEELASQDLNHTISWLQNQEETPEPNEIKRIAAGGVMTFLQDIIDAIKEDQDLDSVVCNWRFVPRVVEELVKFSKQKVRARQELYEQALSYKRIYEQEFENVEEPLSKKHKKDVVLDADEDDDEKTEIMTDDEGFHSDETIEMEEDEVNVAHDRIISEHSKQGKRF